MKITKFLNEMLIANGIRDRKDPFYNKVVKLFKMNSTDWVTYIPRQRTVSFGMMIDRNTKQYMRCSYDSFNKDVHIEVFSTDKKTLATTHSINVICKMCYTEEELFMQSTLNNTTGITLEDLSIIDEIYKKYHKKVKRWK